MLQIKLKNNKKGQEELVGFALIIIIVAIILLFLLSFSLKNNGKDAVESYEVDSFLQSTLQITTECNQGQGFLSVQDLIYECNNQQNCENNLPSCKALNDSLKDIINNSWPFGEARPIKGYEFSIYLLDEVTLQIKEGLNTSNSKGSSQSLPGNIDIGFKAYY